MTDSKGKVLDAKGTSERKFFVGIRGFLLKAIGKNLRVRDYKDKEDVEVTAAKFTAAAGSVALGEENSVTIERSPDTPAPYSLRLPLTSEPGQLSNDGQGNLVWMGGSNDPALLLLVRELQERLEILEREFIQVQLSQVLRFQLINGVVLEIGNNQFTTEFTIETGLGSQFFSVGQIRKSTAPFTELARPKIELDGDKIIVIFWDMNPIPDATVELFVHSLQP